jgi:hypothetical protein
MYNLSFDKFSDKLLLSSAIFLCMGINSPLQAEASPSDDNFNKQMEEFLSQDDNVGKIASALEQYMKNAPQREMEQSFKTL